MKQQRVTRLQEEMLARGLTTLALVPGPNMVYLSGIHSHLSERPVILFLSATEQPVIVMPKLEAMKAEAAGIVAERIFAWTDEAGYDDAFAQAVATLGLEGATIAVEALHMRVLERDILGQHVANLTTVHAEPLMTALRLTKDGDELAAMERAVAVAETAMSKLIPQIKIGQTEKQIAALLFQELLAAGADKLAFDIIVSAGPNGASPHARPTDRPITAGDLLVIDWGAYVDDYPSDLTRTFAVGEIDEELTRIYEAVRLANAAGKAAAVPGVTGEAIDAAARQVIDEAGYGQYFIHRTGHGLGLEVHEEPGIVAGNTAELPVGAVFTVEPGIYLPGRGGVRIEDDVVITTTGHRSLTTMPRQLQVVGL
ncbi:MAG TPA: Xaa-Pro peptidase family protein [Anaerolineae bacterium]|nr:Xaa-Pro peptidase family protein [Anaerolineae bacterium]